MRLTGLLYADDLVLCGELEEDLRAMVGSFVGVQEKRSKSQCRWEQADDVKWRAGTGVRGSCR